MQKQGRGGGKMSSIITGLAVALVFCCVYIVKNYQEQVRDVRLSLDVDIEQLNQHQQFYIALCERVHLDPSIRKTLKYQQRVLKTIGVVHKSEVYDITPAVEAPQQIKRVDYDKSKKLDLDDWRRSQGHKVFGDNETEAPVKCSLDF